MTNKDIEETINAIEYVLSHPEEGSGDTVNDLRKVLTTLRHTWLQQEIEVLEGMKDKPEIEAFVPEIYDAHNFALQTIIDRYKEELNQK